MSRARIDEQLRRCLADNPRELVAAYLYGSAARGTEGPESDVDVAVLLAEPPPPTLEGLPLDLEASLESAVQRPVSVLVLNGAPPDLVHRVLRDGTLLLDRDRSRRIQFEVQSRNEYFDVLALLRRYRGDS